MFTPDTPKRIQVAACMKILTCFLEKNGISGRDVVALKKVRMPITNDHLQAWVCRHS